VFEGKTAILPPVGSDHAATGSFVVEKRLLIGAALLIGQTLFLLLKGALPGIEKGVGLLPAGGIIA